MVNLKRTLLVRCGAGSFLATGGRSNPDYHLIDDTLMEPITQFLFPLKQEEIRLINRLKNGSITGSSQWLI